jgi:hypothetical protein
MQGFDQMPSDVLIFLGFGLVIAYFVIDRAHEK